MKKDSIKKHKKKQNMAQNKAKIHKEEGRRHHDDEKKYFSYEKERRASERAFSDMLRFVVVIYFCSASVAGKYSQKASMYTSIYTRK